MLRELSEKLMTEYHIPRHILRRQVWQFLKNVKIYLKKYITNDVKYIYIRSTNMFSIDWFVVVGLKYALKLVEDLNNN